jgi:hypothetical protein
MWQNHDQYDNLIGCAEKDTHLLGDFSKTCADFATGQRGRLDIRKEFREAPETKSADGGACITEFILLAI